MLQNVTVNVPRDALEHAKTVKEVWRELAGKLSVPNLSFEEFSKKVADADEVATLADKLRRERAELVKRRNEILIEVWDMTKRVRNAAKATFGDASPQAKKFLGSAPPQRKSSSGRVKAD